MDQSTPGTTRVEPACHSADVETGTGSPVAAGGGPALSQTTPCWAVECEWYEGTYTEPMVTLACDNETQAIDNWQYGEYVLGYVATIYRPEAATHAA